MFTRPALRRTHENYSLGCFFALMKFWSFTCRKKVSMRVVFLLNSSRCKYKGSYGNDKNNDEEFVGGKEIWGNRNRRRVHTLVVLN